MFQGKPKELAKFTCSRPTLRCKNGEEPKQKNKYLSTRDISLKLCLRSLKFEKQ